MANGMVNGRPSRERPGDGIAAESLATLCHIRPHMDGKSPGREQKRRSSTGTLVLFFSNLT
jgi:hypothetical protein